MPDGIIKVQKPEASRIFHLARAPAAQGMGCASVASKSQLHETGKIIKVQKPEASRIFRLARAPAAILTEIHIPDTIPDTI